MFPGMNPRKMQQMMKKMGIAQIEIPCNQVIIKTDEGDLIFESPNVSKVNMMGQETFQIVGDYHEVENSSEPEINEEDIKTVVDQTNVSSEKAKEALEESNGDIAEAILNLQD